MLCKDYEGSLEDMATEILQFVSTIQTPDLYLYICIVPVMIIQKQKHC